MPRRRSPAPSRTRGVPISFGHAKGRVVRTHGTSEDALRVAASSGCCGMLAGDSDDDSAPDAAAAPAPRRGAGGGAGVPISYGHSKGTVVRVDGLGDRALEVAMAALDIRGGGRDGGGTDRLLLASAFDDASDGDLYDDGDGDDDDDAEEEAAAEARRRSRGRRAASPPAPRERRASSASDGGAPSGAAESAAPASWPALAEDPVEPAAEPAVPGGDGPGGAAVLVPAAAEPAVATSPLDDWRTVERYTDPLRVDLRTAVGEALSAAERGADDAVVRALLDGSSSADDAAVLLTRFGDALELLSKARGTAPSAPLARVRAAVADYAAALIDACGSRAAVRRQRDRSAELTAKWNRSVAAALPTQALLDGAGELRGDRERVEDAALSLVNRAGFARALRDHVPPPSLLFLDSAVADGVTRRDLDVSLEVARDADAFLTFQSDRATDAAAALAESVFRAELYEARSQDLMRARAELAGAAGAAAAAAAAGRLRIELDSFVAFTRDLGGSGVVAEDIAAATIAELREELLDAERRSAAAKRDADAEREAAEAEAARAAAEADADAAATPSPRDDDGDGDGGGGDGFATPPALDGAGAALQPFAPPALDPAVAAAEYPFLPPATVPDPDAVAQGYPAFADEAAARDEAAALLEKAEEMSAKWSEVVGHAAAEDTGIKTEVLGSIPECLLEIQVMRAQADALRARLPSVAQALGGRTLGAIDAAQEAVRLVEKYYMIWGNRDAAEIAIKDAEQHGDASALAAANAALAAHTVVAGDFVRALVVRGVVPEPEGTARETILRDEAAQLLAWMQTRSAPPRVASAPVPRRPPLSLADRVRLAAGFAQAQAAHRRARSEAGWRALEERAAMAREDRPRRQ
ncbi:hypothetical protein JKP88DRAFT_286327 [Tribonema minus]|uniref:Uncharacterized protein n=1 Tax=Tribonema minus TaxID=303371 RepID=A0A835ZAJ5_9STRA|nr:hypothetical protein JKP88DRAFT_286327 [Tribonema minus]